MIKLTIEISNIKADVDANLYYDYVSRAILTSGVDLEALFNILKGVIEAVENCVKSQPQETLEDDRQ